MLVHSVVDIGLAIHKISKRGRSMRNLEHCYYLAVNMQGFHVDSLLHGEKILPHGIPPPSTQELSELNKRTFHIRVTKFSHQFGALFDYQWWFFLKINNLLHGGSSYFVTIYKTSEAT